MANTLTDTARNDFPWRDYLELCKPKVVALMLLTATVGMCLATKQILSWQVLIFGNLGIGLAAAAGAVINHLVDRHIDAIMQRTCKRPVASGRITPLHAMLFAALLTLVAMFILAWLVNGLTAWLTLFTLIGYAVIYTMFLKRATPQNIVIGGAAGAAPPLLGWVAVTGHIAPQALLLVLIIFVWTPPHFWALAIHRHKEYQQAKIPMLTTTHGIPFTKLSILLYTILLCAITVLPFVIQMSGWIYFIGVCLLNVRFIYWVALLMPKKTRPDTAIKTFRYSIVYLLLLFCLLLVDHYFLLLHLAW